MTPDSAENMDWAVDLIIQKNLQYEQARYTVWLLEHEMRSLAKSLEGKLSEEQLTEISEKLELDRLMRRYKISASDDKTSAQP